MPAQPAASALPVASALPPGLVLRTSRPEDVEQVGELLADRGETDDALDHRLVVEDPDLGLEACAVVVAGDRVVATATLLDEEVRVAGVTLPAGQVELVAVAEDHEHQGLARALMGWAHERSAARGHLLQVMIGIPYFYRRFGYEYAIEMAAARPVAAPAGQPAGTLRRAEVSDLPALAALQAAAQAVVDVAVPHPAARWRALLGQTASTTWVLERDGDVVASARVREDDEERLVAEAAATDDTAARDLLAALAAGRDVPLRVVHRPGTVTGAAWEPVLGPADDGAELYYVRLPDPAPVLDALRPVLAARVGDLSLLGDQLLVSTFGAQYTLPVRDGALGPVEVGGPLQSPGELRGFGVAPDRLAALLLGGQGFEGLRRTHPDVYGPRALGPLLFPPMTADVLSYYLPW